MNMEAGLESKPSVRFQVEKVIGISSDGSYQVQWAPAWVSKFHLVGCEHPIQEFLQQQSEKENEAGRLGETSHVSAASSDFAIQATGVHHENLTPALTEKYSTMNSPDDIDNRGPGHVSSHSQCTDHLLRLSGSNVANTTGGAYELIKELQSQLDQVDSVKIEDDDDGYHDSGITPVSVLMESSNATLSSEPDVGVTDPIENKYQRRSSNKISNLTENSEENSKWTDMNEMEHRTFKYITPTNTFSINRSQYGNSESTVECSTTVMYPELLQRKGDAHEGDDSRTSLVEWQYACHLCSERFSRIDFLNNHFLSHILDRGPYVCHTCNKKFHQRESFNLHLRSHPRKKIHVCSYCNSTFKCTGNLTKHLRTHTGEKPFQCSECGKAFALKGNLNTHMRIHTGDKPYSCDICGMNFTQKISRDRHASHCSSGLKK